MALTQYIDIKVNGVGYKMEVESRRLLVDFLRKDLGLTGSHIGCEHGVCGACTVLFNGYPAQSCLLFAIQADGAEVMTIEGLAKNDRLHPLQESLSKYHGLQCGFCTPGMLISAAFLLNESLDLTEDQIRLGISGNICRCTGYVNIVKAIMSAAVDMKRLSGF
jgi:aerobic carbon-monoxide dehydrogenase small subunit